MDEPLLDRLMPTLGWIGNPGAVWIALLAPFAASSSAILAAKRVLARVPMWGRGMLALAAVISYSRVYVGVHWPTDVAAGVVLGLASGWVGFRLVVRRWSRKPVRPSPKRTNQRKVRKYNTYLER